MAQPLDGRGDRIPAGCHSEIRLGSSSDRKRLYCESFWQIPSHHIHSTPGVSP